ncbi:MAG: excinuclease ABC subunit UvrA [Polyangiales bacterium]
MGRDTERLIRIRGAAEHNLKHIDLDLPRERLVVVTGLSGSGKSSLAFDTLYAEGQRRFTDTLSTYIRRFLPQVRKPAVERIEGLPPTIAIAQRAAAFNPRSTVATTTEIYDHLRLLFARVGTPTCGAPEGPAGERCTQAVQGMSLSAIVDAVLAGAPGRRFSLLAPVLRQAKGKHSALAAQLLQEGFVRARVNGALVDLRQAVETRPAHPLGLKASATHDVEVIVDRLALREGVRARLADSLQTALTRGDGEVTISWAASEDTPAEDVSYRTGHRCPKHPERQQPALEPVLFSFNSPKGACPSCQGLGVELRFDVERVIPDRNVPLNQAIAPWGGGSPAAGFGGRLLQRFCRKAKVRANTHVASLSDAHWQLLWHGPPSPPAPDAKKAWRGVEPMLRDWLERSESSSVREYLQQFLRPQPCPVCQGARLRPEALAVFVRGQATLPEAVLSRRQSLGFAQPADHYSIADLCALDIDALSATIAGLALDGNAASIARPVLREVESRLHFLQSVGLGYLTLERATATLSGGEAQRIRLATQVGSGIVGAAYVLDEPTIGLHPRDNRHLLQTLRQLADVGNSVIVVEHDEEVIRAADHLVDIGPGPGEHGGKVVSAGPVQDVAACPESLTGAYLRGERCIEVPAPEARRPPDEARQLRLRGATLHNLQDFSACLPLGLLVGISGVSGAGKSTLVRRILLPALEAELRRGSRPALPAGIGTLQGVQHIQRLVQVDQSPIGRTPRSNPATYTGVWDDIRQVFAQSPEARMRGYNAGRFSFNVKGGRCEHCQGQGQRRIEMHFMADLFLKCDVCDGRRYNPETLAVRYRGHDIAAILELSVSAAAELFQAHPRIERRLQCLLDVGLGYLRLGQPATTLSGGEAQRIKLAAELGRLAPAERRSEHTLYVFDEPTVGLHIDDVRKLLSVLQRLVEAGHSVWVIEHHLDILKCADWILDLGPEGGKGGGQLVAHGPPEAVAEVPASHTGRFLRELLQPRA